MSVPNRNAVAALLVLVALGSGAEPLAKEKVSDPPKADGRSENNGNNGNGDNGNNQPPVTNDKGSGTALGQVKKVSQPPAGHKAAATPVADQDLALGAVEDDRALPLEAITAKVAQSGGGQVIDARLVTVNGFLLYELKVLNGERLDVQYYYARSGLRVGG